MSEIINGPTYLHREKALEKRPSAESAVANGQRTWTLEHPDGHFEMFSIETVGHFLNPDPTSSDPPHWEVGVWSDEATATLEKHYEECNARKALHVRSAGQPGLQDFWCIEHKRYETVDERAIRDSQLRNVPVQGRSHDRLRSLRRVAAQLYNDPEVGRDGLTTAMIAELSGASIGTVYRYYKSRLDVLNDIAPDRDQTLLEVDLSGDLVEKKVSS